MSSFNLSSCDTPAACHASTNFRKQSNFKPHFKVSAVRIFQEPETTFIWILALRMPQLEIFFFHEPEEKKWY